mgnify:CR=1 FL=1
MTEVDNKKSSSGISIESLKIRQTLPIVQKAISIGLNDREIGVLLGYLGERPHKQFSRIRKSCETDEEAIKLTLKLANSHLVSKLYQLATGAKSEKTTIDYISTPKYGADGKVEIVEKIGKKTTEKTITHPEESAVKLLVHIQLPELFLNAKDIDKSGSGLQSTNSASLSDFTTAIKNGKFRC